MKNNICLLTGFLPKLLQPPSMNTFKIDLVKLFPTKKIGEFSRNHIPLNNHPNDNKKTT